jgi:hypothetical protein
VLPGRSGRHVHADRIPYRGESVPGQQFVGRRRKALTSISAKTKTIISDYLSRFGSLDAVWMDAGKPVPPIDGEDRQDFLELWQQQNLTAIAPTYPVYE